MKRAATAADISKRIIIALDTPSGDEALRIVDQLGGRVGAYKVGLQLFTACGPDIVRRLVEKGERVFLDLKFHDIPNTAASAGIEAARLGVWMFNVHAAGGSGMMSEVATRTRAFCKAEGIECPLVTAVTVLTSMDDTALSEIGVSRTANDQVAALARLAASAGMDGVVCSPAEAAAVKSAAARPEFITVTPGIRAAGATTDDQKRVMPVGSALAGGSDFVVIGRPVTAQSDRLAALEALLDTAA